MRELKFRIWDYKNFSWHDPKTFNLNGEPSFIPGFYQEFEIEQFIGVKDKNDKEIYEGDILKVKGYDGFFDLQGYYFTAVVFYQKSIAAFVYANRPELDIGLKFDYERNGVKRDIEIIGNIHENVELLNESE